jgi:hypothetical protein
MTSHKNHLFYVYRLCGASGRNTNHNRIFRMPLLILLYKNFRLLSRFNFFAVSNIKKQNDVVTTIAIGDSFFRAAVGL